MAKTATPTTTTEVKGSSEEGPVSSSAPLVQPGQALESSRDSGYDLSAAVGEPIDNSIQAGASIVRVRTTIVGDKPPRHVDEIAFGDDGSGIKEQILANALSLGYGTRYNDRAGLGRFGVGLKLATLSHARRLDIYSQPAGSDQIFHAYLDLDDVQQGKQDEIVARPIDGYPAAYADLMTNPKSKAAFASGTLVVWSKIDRLVEGQRFGRALEERLQELVHFLGRAYRAYIDKGLYLELDGREIHLHDPLFLLDNPRVAKKFDNAKAHVYGDDEIDIDGHKVKVRVTLLPERFRHHRGVGAASPEFKDLRIPAGLRHVSILRNGREIFYDVIPKFFPSYKSEDQDRFIGVEIAFPAALDEYFRVRNVKKGAEPDGKLRQELRKLVERPINAARKEIHAHWEKTERAERAVETEHEQAHDAVARAEERQPRGQAGADVDAEQAAEALEDLISDLKLGNAEPEQIENLKRNVETKPIMLVDLDWPGKELLDITHLNGKAIVKVNTRHPFIREVYQPVKELADKDPSQLDAPQVLELARKIEVALDVLFMAYAKAENMDADPETRYGDLRSYWGQFTAAYVAEALRG